MIDKVQGNIPSAYTNSVNPVAGKQPVSNEKGLSIDTQSAEVNLSGDARALQRIMQAAHEAPDVRDDVVKAIKGQLEAGTYEVNVNALADRLLPFLK